MIMGKDTDLWFPHIFNFSETVQIFRGQSSQQVRTHQARQRHWVSNPAKGPQPVLFVVSIDLCINMALFENTFHSLV